MAIQKYPSRIYDIQHRQINDRRSRKRAKSRAEFNGYP